MTDESRTLLSVKRVHLVFTTHGISSSLLVAGLCLHQWFIRITKRNTNAKMSCSGTTKFVSLLPVYFFVR